MQQEWPLRPMKRLMAAHQTVQWTHAPNLFQRQTKQNQIKIRFLQLVATVVGVGNSRVLQLKQN